MKKFEDNVAKLTGRIRKCALFSGNLEDKKILNIGCSFGWFEKYAIEHNCQTIIGIDIDPKRVLEAKESLSHKKVSFKVANSLDLSNFRRGAFDLVTFFDTIEHIPKNTEEKAIREIHSVLKKGGKVIISTPYDNFFSKILDPAWYFGHRHYSKKKLKHFLNKNKFKVTRQEVKGGFWDLTYMNLFYFCKWVLRTNVPFKDYFDSRSNYGYSHESGKGFATIYVEAVKL